MITWIKFSERQPEKNSLCLCSHKGLISVLEWNRHFGIFMDYGIPRNPRGQYCKDPDYWAEINPPGVTVRSGISGLFCNPVTIKLLQDLFSKEPPMPEKPLCKDCRWIHELSIPQHGSAICDSHKAPHSPVDGKGFYFCHDLRQQSFPSSPGYRCELTASEAAAIPPVTETCGPEGRWFEAKGEDKEKSFHEDAKCLRHRIMTSDSPSHKILTSRETLTLIELLEKIS